MSPLVQIHRRCPHPPHHDCAALTTRRLRDGATAPPFSQTTSVSVSNSTNQSEARHEFVPGAMCYSLIFYFPISVNQSNYRYRKFEFPITVNQLILPISENKNKLPVSVIRISDIGKSDDFPISVNRYDLPISKIRITDIDKNFRYR